MKLNKRILNKGLYFILLGAGLSLGTVSCSDYLDTEPITDRPVEVSETPYTKASEAEDLMKTMYVGPGFGHSNYWQLDYFANGSMQTDEAYVSGDNQDNRQQAEYRILSTNGNVKRNWEAIYELINNCNKVLNFVDGIKDPALTAERKAEMKAEAAIVRALYYFHAVQLWGDVPLVTKSVTSVTSENFDEVYSQIYPARKTKEEVYSFIISDLEGALAAAPNASVSKYRATKGVAHALLAKVYIEINNRFSEEDIEADLEQKNWVRPPVKRLNVTLPKVKISEAEEQQHLALLENIKKSESVEPVFLKTTISLKM